ncbi:flagellar basal-body rod protein FlgF [Photobacterium sanguinicancri]|uniref:Flagellar basal-body rod protein FlgF n=1 Tax=Photobacterium sanguinicancri TaxID=875932 RepID=A0AAW7Y756_9GAMM|nr:flagellar basal-body rod protein FlgF [Photobacterium sanguinicancri]KXI24131.1 flagellar biosynthesis protein FlgF [Photobacterium sanguinicancri]MDO6500062.1 flagellar basal-body rod protein FlgF [Photobacterium sanguinicancri]MDO6543551.1 flagellar basal-body rod protein FlgF [Photobacterium sanguinicancri]OZS45644.1 flagellar basal-body rod protein FlgF [Photobacterium sanguinicancri]
MDRALFLAMSGAKQDMHGMQLHANNLANVKTTGFRADLEQARSMQAYGEGLPSRVFAMTERPGQDFSQGSVMTTGRDLDVAVQDQGWLAVMDPSGQEAYTRAGHLKIDQTGMLQNSNGNLMMGENGGPIFVPLPISKIQIGTDGTISVLPQGAPPEAMEVIDRLKLVRPANNELYKDANGLFKSKTPGKTYEADANVKVLKGALEGSNVNAVGEMTSMIDLQRHFEMQVKLMKTAEQMDEASSSLLRMG